MTGTGNEPTRDPHPASEEVASLGAAALAARLAAGELSSVDVTETLIARIEAIDPPGPGPGLRSILELAPDALETAAALDAEGRAGTRRGALHGIPVLVKDNVDTAAPLHTTAGSLIFGDCPPAGDATLVTALRDAGALVIGKANLSEWANFRSSVSSSGWSAAGGQTRNPHVLDRSPGGSSSGSAAAVAARLVPLAVGTETDGSIICPAAACGVAGMKPTLGLVSRTGIVPIAATQDTAGPLARSAADLALLLEALAGAVDDGEDRLARRARRPNGHDTRYVGQLGDGDLSGLRVGVVRADAPSRPMADQVFDTALAALADAGAQLVDPVDGLDVVRARDRMTVLTHEFRASMHAYLARRAERSPGCAHLPRTLDDILVHAAREPRERTDLFATDLIARSAATAGLASDAYRRAFRRNRRGVRTALDARFSAAGADVLVVPSMPPAWPIDHVLGDPEIEVGWSPSAIAGYPSATIPAGSVAGLPVCVTFLGRPWTEGLLLRVMAALEQALGAPATSPVPRFAPSTGLVTATAG